MTKRERYEKVMDFFRNEMPEANTELEFGSIFQLLVAVVLSAQCTDKRVNQVTPQLFARYPDAKAMAAAEPEELLDYISSVSYPNAKAKHLAGLARTLVERHNGEVPEDMNALLDLPGVGRKTANVVGAVIWGKEVMPVDTHVFRVSARIGLTRGAKTPLQTELQLEKNIPSHLLPVAHHWLILHGRYVCTARAPKCDACGIAPWCKSREKQKMADK